MGLGDSKTLDGWMTPLLTNALTTASNLIWDRLDFGEGGYSAVEWAAAIDAYIAANWTTQSVDYVLLDLGVNDVAEGSTENQFKTSLQYIIDAIHAKQTSTKIYIAKVWYRAASTANVNTWITSVIAANPGVCFAGHDETVWLEGGDNGATMTYDGTHYIDPAGYVEIVNQWKTILGY